VRIPESDARAWVNGRWTSAGRLALSIDDHGFHAGLGLFETIGVLERRPLDLAQHIDRLADGAPRLGIVVPEHRELERAALEVAAGEAGDRGWLKIICTRGGMCAVFGGIMDPAEAGQSARAVLLPWRRNPADPLAGLKTLNYAPNLLGLEKARRDGADEGLWLNVRGHVAEGCTSNLFVVQRRKLFTPAVRDGILPGIVRGQVLRLARRIGCIVHVGKLRLKRLRQADEVFLTSSLRGVRPLVEIDGRPVGRGEAGPLTLRIAADFERMRRPRPDARVDT
jgi:branched-subunit amino acid aminotransferase/4-amino-4-deoxychorismate lyase